LCRGQGTHAANRPRVRGRGGTAHGSKPHGRRVDPERGTGKSIMTGVAAGRRICVIEEVMLDDGDIGNIAAIGPVGDPPRSKYERLLPRAQPGPPAPPAVVHPREETPLRAPVEAPQAGIIVPILVGPAMKIAAVAREHRLAIDRFEIVDVPHSDAAAAKAVELIHASKGELLMKG